jgi:hypothetical protein
VDITAALAADLILLTQALDDPGAELTATLSKLADDARLAISSYLGLSVQAAAGEEPFEFSAFDAGAVPGAILASVLLPLSAAGDPAIAVILYAGIAGAFVDLATDLTWLTGLGASSFVVDQHLNGPPPASAPSPLSRLSTLNQAIGVLVARGATPEQALAHLDAQALSSAQDRDVVAAQILASLDRPSADG